MHLDCYQYLAKNDYYDYEFVSDGPKGKIRKAVRFTKVRDGNPASIILALGILTKYLILLTTRL